MEPLFCGISTPPINKCDAENNSIWKTIKALAIQKCEMVVPISSQLPESLTRKKKFNVITSVVDSTRRNNEKGGSSNDLDRSDSTEESRKNGTKILNSSNPPIKNGSKTVVNLYTDSIVNEEIDAIFPVPKKAILRKKRKKLAILISLDVSFLGDVETVSLEVSYF